MMTTRGIASMLERAYRDVRDGGVSLDELRARVQSASRALRNNARTRLVLRAWTEYERLIAQLGAIDPAELFDRAAKAVAKGAEVKPQLLAGFYDMTRVQLRLVEALRDAGHLAAAWLPIDPASDDYRFANQFVAALGDNHSGLSTQDSGLGRHDSVLSPQSSVLSVHDTKIAELETVARAIRALLDNGTEPRTIGVVARSIDPYDARLFHRFAGELQFGTTYAEETPLGGPGRAPEEGRVLLEWMTENESTWRQ